MEKRKKSLKKMSIQRKFHKNRRYKCQTLSNCKNAKKTIQQTQTWIFWALYKAEKMTFGANPIQQFRLN